MTRTIVAGIALAGVLGAAACRSHPPPPPSVLLISIDTLRADRLNCYGYNGRIISPNLDSLARESILFERHYASAPWTTPSHMSLFTGLSPSAHGVTTPFEQLNAGVNGHPGRIPALARSIPTLPEILSDRGWTSAAFTGGVTLDPRIGFGRGFALYDTSMFKLRRKNMRRLTGWIDAHANDRFFLFWHTFEVHAPYLSGTFLRQVLEPDEAKRLSRALTRMGRRDDRPSRRQGRSLLQRRGAFAQRVTSALYDGGVLSMDRHIGRIIERLRASGSYDDTLIIVTSDHGEQLGERDGGFYNVHGRTLYEEMVRVPLIVKLPRQAFAGRRVAQVTRAIDVMPTVLDLTVGPVSDPVMQGESLRPLWEPTQPKESPRLALSEATAFEIERKSLHTRRHNYILTIGADDVKASGRSVIPKSPDRVELYDLDADPTETHNLLASSGDAEGREGIQAIADHLDNQLRERVQSSVGQHEVLEGTGDDTLEGLRALGYVE